MEVRGGNIKLSVYRGTEGNELTEGLKGERESGKREGLSPGSSRNYRRWILPSQHLI